MGSIPHTFCQDDGGSLKPGPVDAVRFRTVFIFHKKKEWEETKRREERSDHMRDVEKCLGQAVGVNSAHAACAEYPGPAVLAVGGCAWVSCYCITEVLLTLPA